MGGNSPPVKGKREPAVALFGYLNAATYHHIVRRIALASIALAVVFCLPDHTITVQSATVDRVQCELLDITNALKINVESGKHGDNCEREV